MNKTGITIYTMSGHRQKAIPTKKFQNIVSYVTIVKKLFDSQHFTEVTLEYTCDTTRFISSFRQQILQETTHSFKCICCSKWREAIDA